MSNLRLQFRAAQAALAFLFIASSVAAQPASPLRPYEVCSFSNGLSVEHIDGLGMGVTSRPVKTRRGTQPLQLAAGRRVMIGFPEDNFFANVKAELLPIVNYSTQRQLLVDGFDYTLASDASVSRNYDLHTPLNGFDIVGLDRTKLEGGVLGIYLLFDDAAHTATTIYLLDQKPEFRKFSDMAGYTKLRDQFLRQYTACVRQNQHTP